MFKRIVLIALLAFVFSCSESPTDSNGGVVTSLSGAFILNEGAWGQNNGSLSFYDFENKTIQNNIYEAVNGEKLGDVVHSMTLIDTLGYICVNGSDVIKVISVKNWKKVGEIVFPAGSGPRYLAQVGPSRAYVTNLAANSVSVVNLNSLEITNTIDVGANPEQLTVTNGKAYVACSGFGYGNSVSVIDINRDEVIATIRVGDNPVAIKDFGARVYVQCGGSFGSDFNDPSDDTDGGIFVIDPTADVLQDSLVIEGHPSGFTVGNGNGYYFVDGAVVAFKLQNLALLGVVANGNFYDIAVDDVSDRLFAVDPLDYQQAGILHVYGLSGSDHNTYQAGIIPGEIVFVYAFNEQL